MKQKVVDIIQHVAYTLLGQTANWQMKHSHIRCFCWISGVSENDQMTPGNLLIDHARNRTVVRDGVAGVLIANGRARCSTRTLKMKVEDW
jgi:hypothetical protein